MSYAEGWQDRLKRAMWAKAMRLGVSHVTSNMLAEGVAKELRLKSPHTHQAANRWKHGSSIPPAEIAIALARYLDVDPGWLICGPASSAPEPTWLAAQRSIDLTPFVEARRQRRHAAEPEPPRPRHKPRPRR